MIDLFLDRYVPHQILTTNVAYDPTRESKLSTKLSGKWGHPCGISVDKLEFANDGKVTTETSLITSAEGLKLEFKANDSDKGDLGFIYKHKNVTVTGEFDTLNCSKANGSISLKHGRFAAGAIADIKIAKTSISSTAFTLGGSYERPNAIFAGVRASKNMSEYSGIVTFVANPNTVLAGNILYATKSKSTTGALASVYKFDADTSFKLKAASTGTLNASVKRQLDKKFVVIGSAEIPSSFSGFKFGVNATLG